MKTITQGDFWELLSAKEQKNFTGIVDWGNGLQLYYQNGKAHRIDGPAYIGPNGQVSYWIDGERVSKEAQELYYSLMKLKGLV